MNYCGRSGYAVGLSAISLLAPVPAPVGRGNATSLQFSRTKKSRSRSQIPLPKDAAPIPTAFWGINN